METNKIIIITTRSGNKSRIDLLHKLILKKQQIFARINSRYELLLRDLDQIKREYMLRIGTLIDKDNRLDMDIIIHKNILTLIKEGLTYEQAVNQLKDNTYSGMFDNYDFQENTDFKTEYFTNFAENKTEKMVSDSKLKTLWKKAVLKFHPDLSTDPTEKQNREIIMKQINRAYFDGDIVTLKQLYNSTLLKSLDSATIEELELLLINIENKIIKLRKEYGALRKTVWFTWRKKINIAKKSGFDIFREMEDSLLDDVVRKMRILSDIKQELQYYKNNS